MGLMNDISNAGAGLLGGAASSITGGAINQAFNQTSIENQVDAQERLAKYQSDLNYENQMKLWQNTNYQQQREQMEKAGLNIGLMYKGAGEGGSTGTGAGSGGSVSSTVNTNGINATSTLQGLMMKAQIDNMNADTEEKLSRVEANKNNVNVQNSQKGLNEANTSKAEAETNLTKTNNAIQELNNQFQKDTYENNISRFNTLTDQAIQNLRIMQNSAYVSDNTLKEQVEQVKSNLAETLIGIQAKKAGINLTNKEIWQLENAVNQAWKSLDIQHTNAITNMKGTQAEIDQGWERLMQNIKQLGLNQRQTSVLENKQDQEMWKNLISQISGIIK